MVGIVPNEASILRLVGAVLLEADVERASQHRRMQVEAVAEPFGSPLVGGDATPADNTEATPQVT